MADYYPLISKAVAGLEKNTGEARRALYERARTALVTQLRAMTPALSESDITRERLALEEAIRRIEAEAARSARLEPIVRDKPKPPEPAPPKTEPPPAPVPAPEDKSAEPKTPDTPPPPRPPRPTDGRSLSDQGLKGFRDVVAEAETLGEATAQASKSARAAFASVPLPGAEKERTEPHIEPEGLRPPPRRPAPPPPRVPVPPREPPNRETGRGAAAPAPPRGNDVARDMSVPRETARGLGGMGLDSRVPEDMRLGEEARPREPEERERDYSAPDFQERPFPLGREEGRRHQPVLQDDQIEPEAGGRQWGPLIAIAGVVVLALAIIGVGVWQWPTLMGMFKSSPAVVTAPPPSAPQPAPGAARKDPGRLGAQNAPAPQGAAVAQRVVLYEEDPADPAGKRYVGSAVWRTEQVAAAPGQPADMAVRAEIEIPERKMTMKWSLRRNTDKALPASHTVEIMFQLPPDFPHGGISNIPGILMKQAEQTRGVPLAGLSVKVTDLFFLIGLSSVEGDMQRNIQLLKERSWFDVPVVYTDGRRAIMAVEKGNPGDRAFADAFAAWGQ